MAELVAKDLTKDQRLLLLSVSPDVAEGWHPAPDWLIEECCRLGLMRRVGVAVALTDLGERLRAEMLA